MTDPTPDPGEALPDPSARPDHPRPGSLGSAGAASAPGGAEPLARAGVPDPTASDVGRDGDVPSRRSGGRDDAALWERIAADDADAFGLLFARHGPRIHGYVLRRTADADTADDVTAAVFLEAWRRRRSVALHQSSALPWLYGVAANVTRRWQRSSRRHRAALDRMAALPERRPELVEVQADAAARAAVVLDQVRDLPRRERDVLVLSVWEGLSHAEIAVALGIAPGTVKSRLSRARARLDPDAAPSPDPPLARPASPIHPHPLIPTENLS